MVRARTLQVGYLVHEFPKLSETFVLDEVKGHIENGIDIHVFSLTPVRKTSPSQANLQDLSIQVINVFKMRRGKLRLVEKIVLALLELARQRHLQSILFDARLGGWQERMTAIALARFFRLNRDAAELDLLHCHFGPNGRYAAILKEHGVFNGPILTTFHAWELTSLLKRRGPGFYDELFQFGSLFLPISEFWIPKLVELGCDRSRIRVHRMGIDCDAILYQERPPEPGAPVRPKTTAASASVLSRAAPATSRASRSGKIAASTSRRTIASSASAPVSFSSTGAAASTLRAAATSSRSRRAPSCENTSMAASRYRSAVPRGPERAARRPSASWLSAAW